MSTTANIRRTRPAAAAVKEELADAKITVTRSGFGQEEEVTDTIEVRKFATEPAYVRVNAGVTKSTGNYESLRVDVSVTVPCYVEEIDDVAARAAEFVAARLDAEVNAYLPSEE